MYFGIRSIHVARSWNSNPHIVYKQLVAFSYVNVALCFCTRCNVFLSITPCVAIYFCQISAIFLYALQCTFLTLYFCLVTSRNITKKLLSVCVCYVWSYYYYFVHWKYGKFAMTKIGKVLLCFCIIYFWSFHHKLGHVLRQHILHLKRVIYRGKHACKWEKAMCHAYCMFAIVLCATRKSILILGQLAKVLQQRGVLGVLFCYLCFVCFLCSCYSSNLTSRIATIPCVRFAWV